MNGFCDEAHDVVGVIIKLMNFRSSNGRDG